MFKFSSAFSSAVIAHFGQDVSPRLVDALDEGDIDFVETYLRGSKIDPTWEMFAEKAYVDLKVLADRQKALKQLSVQCFVERTRSLKEQREAYA